MAFHHSLVLELNSNKRTIRSLIKTDIFKMKHFKLNTTFYYNSNVLKSLTFNLADLVQDYHTVILISHFFNPMVARFSFLLLKLE